MSGWEDDDYVDPWREELEDERHEAGIAAALDELEAEDEARARARCGAGNPPCERPAGHYAESRFPSESGATTAETISGMIFMLALLLTLLVWRHGWPGQNDGASLEEQRKTRHAICEVLAVTGADATNAADVAACTFGEDD